MPKRERFAAWAAAVVLTLGLPSALDQGYFRYNPYPLPILGLVAVLIYLGLAITSNKCKTIMQSLYLRNPKLSIIGFVIVGFSIFSLLWVGERTALKKSKEHVNQLQAEDKKRTPLNEGQKPPATPVPPPSPEIPAEKKESRKKELPPLFPPQREMQTQRPYFRLIGPNTIKATPELKAQFGSNYVTQINIENIGKHTASNLHNRQITIDQNFQLKPSIAAGSKGNDFSMGSAANYYEGVDFPPIVLASYMVFAIKYEDKEISPLKTFYQIWCFKQPGGTDKEPPLHFMETSILERENILNHLKQELSDYGPPKSISPDAKRKKEPNKEVTPEEHIPEVQKTLPPKDSLGRVMVSTRDNPRRICKNHPVDDFSRQLEDKLKISVVAARKENNKQVVDGILSIVQGEKETKLEKFTSVEVGTCMKYEIYSIRVSDIFSDYDCAIFQVSLNERPSCKQQE